MVNRQWMVSVWVACVLAFSPGVQAAGKKASGGEGVQPFGLMIGKSTLDEVSDKAEALGGALEGVYNGFANTTYIDNDPNGVVNPHVVIRKYTGLPVDGIKLTSFRFLDGVLFGVLYEVDSSTDGDHLLNALRAKYGPAKSNWSDDEYSWSVGATVVYFKKALMDGQNISIYRPDWMRKVVASNKEVYDEFIRNKARQQQGF